VGAHQEDPVVRDREGERGEYPSTLFRRVVQIVDQDDGRALGGEFACGVHEHGLQRVLVQLFCVGRGCVPAQQCAESRDEERRDGQVVLQGLLDRLLAEVLAIGCGERAGRGRRAAGRVGAEQEVEILPLLLEPPHEFVHQPGLADACLPLQQDDLAISGFRLLIELCEHREIVVPAVERGLSRDANATERPPRRLADCLRALYPPVALFSLLENRLHPDEAVARLSGEQSTHDLLEKGAELRVELRYGPRLLAEPRPHDRGEVVGLAGQLAGGEFVEDEPQGVEVGAGVGLLGLELLRRRVEHGADEAPRL
jgi:hypothetical protein